MCGGTLAIDGVGRIWSESGCEHTSTGIVSSERLTPAQKRRFDAALVKARRLRDMTEYPRCASSDYPGCASFSTIVLLEANGRQHTWRVSPPNNIPAELAALEAVRLDSPEP